MRLVLFGLIFVSISPALSMRQQTALTQQKGNFQDFQSWAAQHCRDCNKIFGSLIQGVIDAGYLQKSSISWDQNVLQVQLDHENLYGEMATKSRVPLAWTLKKKNNLHVCH